MDEMRFFMGLGGQYKRGRKSKDGVVGKYYIKSGTGPTPSHKNKSLWKEIIKIDLKSTLGFICRNSFFFF